MTTTQILNFYQKTYPENVQEGLAKDSKYYWLVAFLKDFERHQAEIELEKEQRDRILQLAKERLQKRYETELALLEQTVNIQLT